MKWSWLGFLLVGCLVLLFAAGCGDDTPEDDVPIIDEHHLGGGNVADSEDGGENEGEQAPTDDNQNPPLELVVMTYNILFDFPNPEYYGWQKRKEHQADVIARYDPDLIGLQEPLWWQVGDLQAVTDGYAAVKFDLHPDSTILYKAERFSLLDEGHYFLSPWPDLDFSIGFGNFLPRLVVWVKLWDWVADREFYFVDTHFDNTAPFQENAAPLFLARTAPLAADAPTVITGDFNSKPDREAYFTLTEGVNGEGFHLTNSFDVSPTWEAVQSEWDERVYDPVHRIDHIFFAGAEFACAHWVVDMVQYGDPPRDPSDHFPMIAYLSLP